MAIPGNGVRRAVDVLAEVSFHIVEPVLDAIITATGPAGFGDPTFGYNGDSSDGGGFGFGLGDYATLSVPIEFYLYPGALIVVDYRGPNEEVAEVTSVDFPSNTFYATFVNSHSAGERVFAPTFPTQQPTDPLWTQAEMLGYLADAQNELLAQVPIVLELFPDQQWQLGVTTYALPATAIELERVAVQNNSLDYALSTLTRTAGVVTAMTTTPTPFSPLLAVYVNGVADSSFNSLTPASSDWFSLTGVSADGYTLTWNVPSTYSDASSTGGTISQLLYQRLYESSQDQLAMRDPYWFYNQESDVPTIFYEDRTGVYQYGVAPQPRAGFYADLIASQRDSTALTLLDGFVAPDIFVYAIKYKTLQYALTKDGEQRSPMLARYAGQRFDMTVQLARRFLRNMVEPPQSQGRPA
jgi:hypothetical protein